MIVLHHHSRSISQRYAKASHDGGDRVLICCEELSQSCHLPIEPRRINDHSAIAHEAASAKACT